VSNFAQIKGAVEKACKCAVEHTESVPVIETFHGEVVWQGRVEVFVLSRPPGQKAYGWMTEHQGEPEYIVVVGKPPVDAPLAAVRAWIVLQLES
jgi:hypothetical protein